MYIKLYRNRHVMGGTDLMPMLRITKKAVIFGIFGAVCKISTGKPHQYQYNHTKIINIK
jgi:hypothetical protein